MMFVCTRQMAMDGSMIYPGMYALKIEGEDYIVIGAQGFNHDINLISSKEELLECGYFIDEGKVKTMLNVEILNKLNDGSAANVLKNILFDGENKIDWNEAYNLMLVFMPELNKVDGYKLENMGWNSYFNTGLGENIMAIPKTHIEFIENANRFGIREELIKFVEYLEGKKFNHHKTYDITWNANTGSNRLLNEEIIYEE